MKFIVLLLSFLLLSFVTSAQDRPPSATANVHILDSMEMPGLDRYRTIRIYLPPGYEQSNQRYSVMYMHDGQNLFDDATSYAGEWGVDENMNDLSKSNDLNLIVVGIDNGQDKRMNELGPWPNQRFGKAEGAEYMQFIVEVVKPFIDKNYRTKPGKEHTALMGSSMGGLISHYGIYAYPEVFSKAGIFSPSYWFSQKVFEFTKENPLPTNYRLYLIVGEKEGPGMTQNMKKMHQFILDEGHPKTNIFSKVNPEGEHNEAFWRSEFKSAVLWLFEAED